MSKNIPSDAELNALIAEKKKKAAVGTAIIVVGVVVLLGMVLMGMVILGTIVGILILAVGLGLRYSATWAVKAAMTDAAILPALQEVFDKVVYKADEHIPDEVIENTDMGFWFDIDKIHGSDYVKAEYKGVSIELSDISIETHSYYTDSDGDTQDEWDTNFRGMWLICDFHKRFSADLLLREKKGLTDKIGRQGIQTENEAFNKQFFISSESEHDVFYILTPHMMEYIQAMDKKAGGQTYMRFEKEGKLHVALDTGRDAFEINKLGKASAESLRKQFIDEVRYVTDLIDELHLVKTLYAK